MADSQTSCSLPWSAFGIRCLSHWPSMQDIWEMVEQQRRDEAWADLLTHFNDTLRELGDG